MHFFLGCPTPSRPSLPWEIAWHLRWPPLASIGRNENGVGQSVELIYAWKAHSYFKARQGTADLCSLLAIPSVGTEFRNRFGTHEESRRRPRLGKDQISPLPKVKTSVYAFGFQPGTPAHWRSRARTSSSLSFAPSSR